MVRLCFKKIQTLEGRHPGLCEKVHTMLAEFWPPHAVKQMIESHYGECLSVRSIERYKHDHWQAQRDMVQQIIG